jgi:membrane protease YdiL (CAAX protease family)
LAPYRTVSHWQPWPAFWVTVALCAATVAVALGGALLLTGQSGSAGDTLRAGRGLLPLLAAQALMSVGAILAARAKGDRLVDVLALYPPARPGVGTYLRSLGLLLLTVSAATVFGHFFIQHDATTDLRHMAGIFRGPWWPLALVVIAVGAPLSEELLFRGFLQSALVPTRLGYWGASLVTTTLWTAMHAGYTVFGIAEVFVIGLLFCRILRRTGSLRVTIACHAMYNALISLVVMVAPPDVLGF